MSTSNYIKVNPAGYQSISATSSTAVGITISAASAASASKPVPNYAVIVAETAGIRWRDDGTAPVNAASGGFPVAAGLPFEYDGPLAAIQFVSQAGTATVHVATYRTF